MRPGRLIDHLIGPKAVRPTAIRAAPNSSGVKGFPRTAEPGSQSPTSAAVAVMKRTGMLRQLQIVWTAAIPHPSARRTSEVIRFGQHRAADSTALVSVAA